MIRIGNILINPFDISSIHEELKLTTDVKFRGTQIIQIVYKNGVVKNFTSQEIGMSYLDFIEHFMRECEIQKENELFKKLIAVKSLNNE
jgi:hypothetical protein